MQYGSAVNYAINSAVAQIITLSFIEEQQLMPSSYIR